MFAKEDLIQVKAPKGDFKDKKTPTWFVPYSRLEDFRDEKRKNVVERLADGKPRVYKEGDLHPAPVGNRPGAERVVLHPRKSSPSA